MPRKDPGSLDLRGMPCKRRGTEAGQPQPAEFLRHPLDGSVSRGKGLLRRLPRTGVYLYGLPLARPKRVHTVTSCHTASETILLLFTDVRAGSAIANHRARRKADADRKDNRT